ncbi:DUF6705 family protein [Aurantibacter sp.]|uniref:DUF6705 family protein n=1 Tax=Aurantibacter sp. TaxID=2807103 RepID=UPI0035C8346D
MKKILFILILFICVNLQAQDIIIPIEDTSEHTSEDNHYYKDVNNLLDKYTGTWIFDNGIDYFEIVFYVEERVEISLGSISLVTYYADELRSSFIYKKNGLEIYNTVGSTDIASVSCFATTNVGSFNKLGCIYLEPEPFIRVQQANLDLEYIPGISGNSDEMIWVRNELPSLSLLTPDGNGNTPSNVEFNIPANMTLVKQ